MHKIILSKFISENVPYFFIFISFDIVSLEEIIFLFFDKRQFFFNGHSFSLIPKKLIFFLLSVVLSIFSFISIFFLFLLLINSVKSKFLLLFIILISSLSFSYFFQILFFFISSIKIFKYFSKFESLFLFEIKISIICKIMGFSLILNFNDFKYLLNSLFS